jgi:hypothetical protein
MLPLPSRTIERGYRGGFLGWEVQVEPIYWRYLCKGPGAHRSREVHRPIERRKGGEEDRCKPLRTARAEGAGEDRTIESASERPLGKSNEN